MPAWFKSLVKGLAEILAWAEVWDYWESLKDTRGGKAVRAVIAIAFTAVIAWVVAHPILIYAIATFILGWIVARLISWRAAKHRAGNIDWYALSFQLPIEIANSGLWLNRLALTEPFVAFKFALTNATKRPVEITDVRGSFNINGPCNTPARLASYHITHGIKFGPQIACYEISIEQPVTRENADVIIETLKQSDGYIRFGLSEVQLIGTVALDTDNIVDLENCYLDRTSKGTIGMGILLRGPMDPTSSNEQIGRLEGFVSMRIFDAQGRALPIAH
jgi:hypothetical protein